jgi:hypothetical protein
MEAPFSWAWGVQAWMGLRDCQLVRWFARAMVLELSGQQASRGVGGRKNRETCSKVQTDS